MKIFRTGLFLILAALSALSWTGGAWAGLGQAATSWSSQQWRLAVAADKARAGQMKEKRQQFAHALVSAVSQRAQNKDPLALVQKIAAQDARDFLEIVQSMRTERGRPADGADASLANPNSDWNRYVRLKTKRRNQLQARIELLRAAAEQIKTAWVASMRLRNEGQVFLNTPGASYYGLEIYKTGVAYLDQMVLLNAYLNSFRDVLAGVVGFTDVPKKNYADFLDQRVERSLGPVLQIGPRYSDALYIELEKLVAYTEEAVNPHYYQSLTCGGLIRR